MSSNTASPWRTPNLLLLNTRLHLVSRFQWCRCDKQRSAAAAQAEGREGVTCGGAHAQVREAASRGPEGEVAQAPPGFAFDPSTGYYYSAEAGLYYDASSGGYYSSSAQKWYSYDAAAQQYVEWPDAAAG